MKTFLVHMRTLFWKNLLLRRRNPIFTTAEILSPILIPILVVVLRWQQPGEHVDPCHSQSISMPSMGIFRYFHSMLCNFAYSCYPTPPADPYLDFGDRSFVERFLKFADEINNTNGRNGAQVNVDRTTFQLIKLLEFVNQSIDDSLIKSILNGMFTTESNGHLRNVSKLFCGISQITDQLERELSRFHDKKGKDNFELIENKSSSPLPSVKTEATSHTRDYCGMWKKIVLHPLFEGYFNRLSFALSGIIYYYPVNKFTKKVMERATFERHLLNRFHKSLRHYQDNTSPNLHRRISTLEQSISRICQRPILDASYQIFCRQFAKIDQMGRRLNQIDKLIRMAVDFLSCFNLSGYLIPVEQEEEFSKLNERLQNISYPPGIGIHFKTLLTQPIKPDSLNQVFEIVIRQKQDKIDKTHKDIMVNRFPWVGPRRNPTWGVTRYITNGFLDMQETIGHAILSILLNKEDRFDQPVDADQILSNPIPGHEFSFIPTSCYTTNKFLGQFAILIPQMLLFGFLITCMLTTKYIVDEKEQRLKEFTTIMGLTDSMHWLGWIQISVVILSIGIISSTLILKFGQVYSSINYGLLLFIFISYGFCLIGFSFLCSTLVNQAKLAAVLSGILFFAFNLPTRRILINSGSYSGFGISGWCLSFQVAFSLTLYYVAAGEWLPDGGAQWDQFWFMPYSTDQYSIGKCLLMMWTDGVVFYLMAFYFDSVLPRSFGTRKPFYFIFTKQFWTKTEQGQVLNENSEINLDEWEILCSKHPNSYETRLTSTKELGVYVQNLCKTYEKALKPSLDNLTLGFQSNQITSLLGHNGAGKSTLISILTGMQMGTSGRVIVAGFDVHKDLEQVRKKLGFCPQYNVLFDRMTVEEHIKFYALLKGMVWSEIKRTIEKLLNILGFEDKKSTMTKKLSGGQKRKLSVALAFLGDSSVVFLDEPTAGVDPLSRRGIWDLILQLRVGRTIILTTHHMDEADMLGDCIAIVSKGRLKCYGSSLFLKQHHGHGYYLVFHIDPANRTDTGELKNSVDLLLQNYIPEARISEVNPKELIVEIPASYALDGSLSRLLEHLEDSEHPNLSHFSLADTSLEDIFIDLADDPANSMEEQKKTFDARLSHLSDNGQLPHPVVRRSIRSCDYNPKTHLEIQDLWRCETVSISPRAQIKAMFMKRIHNFKRHKLGWAIEFLVPVSMVLFIQLFTNFTDPAFANRPLNINPWWMVNRHGGHHLEMFYADEVLSNHISTPNEKNLMNSILNVSRTYDQLVQDPYALTGARCLPKHVYSIEPHNLGGCHDVAVNTMRILSESEITQARSSMNVSCDCTRGIMNCPETSIRPNPPPSAQLATSDTLFNLTYYNIPDYLVKTATISSRIRFGGITFKQSIDNLTSRGLIESLLDPNNELYHVLGMLTASSEIGEPDPFWKDMANIIRLALPPTHTMHIWFNNKGFIAAPSYLNLVQNMQLRWILKSQSSTVDPPQHAMIFINHPLDYPAGVHADPTGGQDKTQITDIMFIVLALSFVPANLCSFLVYEAQIGAKQLQLVSGLNIYIYWLTVYVWDVCNYLITAFLCFSVYVCFGEPAYVAADTIGAFLTLLVLYGLAIVPMMYPSTFVIKSRSSSLIILSVSNLLISFLTMTIVLVIDIVSETNEGLEVVSDILNLIFLVAPQFCLSGGMYQLALRSEVLSNNRISGNQTASLISKWENPFGMHVLGDKLIALCLHMIFWPFVVLVMEKKFFMNEIHTFLHRRFPKLAERSVKRLDRKLNGPGLDIHLNRDVEFERDRINELQKSNELFPKYPVAALKLSKIFGRRKVPSVNQLHFALQPHECFGLLGLNGAGKTTTFRMLTGSLSPTYGKVFINGFDMTQQRTQAYQNLGYCPQFDALFDLLTGRESLALYARLRGTPECEIANRVDQLINKMGLAPHADKVVEAYSGGNKRKLSTAIAILGSPQVILLDEPTSGMDPVGKRFIWDQITTLLKAGKSVVLTSHCMAECEALCNRVGIMVNGQFKCVGTVHELKQRYGNGYLAEIRLSSVENHSVKDDVSKQLKQTFPNVMLRDTGEQYQTYQFPEPIRLSLLFTELNILLQNGLILHYSVRRTCLDQVFVDFTRMQIGVIPEDANIDDLEHRT